MTYTTKQWETGTACTTLDTPFQYPYSGCINCEPPGELVPRSLSSFCWGLSDLARDPTVLVNNNHVDLSGVYLVSLICLAAFAAGLVGARVLKWYSDFQPANRPERLPGRAKNSERSNRASTSHTGSGYRTGPGPKLNSGLGSCPPSNPISSSSAFSRSAIRYQRGSDAPQPDQSLDDLDQNERMLIRVLSELKGTHERHHRHVNQSGTATTDQAPPQQHTVDPFDVFEEYTPPVATPIPRYVKILQVEGLKGYAADGEEGEEEDAKNKNSIRSRVRPGAAGQYTQHQYHRKSNVPVQEDISVTYLRTPEILVDAVDADYLANGDAHVDGGVNLTGHMGHRSGAPAVQNRDVDTCDCDYAGPCPRAQTRYRHRKHNLRLQDWETSRQDGEKLPMPYPTSTRNEEGNGTRHGVGAGAASPRGGEGDNTATPPTTHEPLPSIPGARRRAISVETAKRVPEISRDNVCMHMHMAPYDQQDGPSFPRRMRTPSSQFIECHERRPQVCRSHRSMAEGDLSWWDPIAQGVEMGDDYGFGSDAEPIRVVQTRGDTERQNRCGLGGQARGTGRGRGPRNVARHGRPHRSCEELNGSARGRGGVSTDANVDAVGAANHHGPTNNVSSRSRESRMDLFTRLGAQRAILHDAEAGTGRGSEIHTPLRNAHHETREARLGTLGGRFAVLAALGDGDEDDAEDDLPPADSTIYGATPDSRPENEVVGYRVSGLRGGSGGLLHSDEQFFSYPGGIRRHSGDRSLQEYVLARDIYYGAQRRKTQDAEEVVMEATQPKYDTDTLTRKSGVYQGSNPDDYGPVGENCAPRRSEAPGNDSAFSRSHQAVGTTHMRARSSSPTSEEWKSELEKAAGLETVSPGPRPPNATERGLCGQEFRIPVPLSSSPSKQTPLPADRTWRDIAQGDRNEDQCKSKNQCICSRCRYKHA